MVMMRQSRRGSTRTVIPHQLVLLQLSLLLVRNQNLKVLVLLLLVIGSSCTRFPVQLWRRSRENQEQRSRRTTPPFAVVTDIPRTSDTTVSTASESAKTPQTTPPTTRHDTTRHKQTSPSIDASRHHEKRSVRRPRDFFIAPGNDSPTEETRTEPRASRSPERRR